MSETDGADVLESLARLPTLAHPTASPGGDEVAFYYDVSGRNELHVLDVDTGAIEQWSDGEVPRNARWFVRWGTDADRVYFHQDEGGNEQNDVYAIDRDGAVEPVVRSDGQNLLQDVGAGGETLLLTSNRDGQMNVFGHDLPTGETTKLTDYERAVHRSVFSPGADRIAYCTNETDDFDNLDVYVADRDGSDPRNLEVGEVGAEAVPVEWGPEGDRLLVTDNTEDLGRIGVYHLDRDSVTWYGDRTAEEEAVGFLPAGDRVVGLRTRDVTAVPVVYDLDSGEGWELDLPAGVVTVGGMFGADVVLGDDRIVLQHTTPTTRPELLAYDLGTGEVETLVEAEYGPFSPADFADAEHLVVESDGVPDTRTAAVELDPAADLEIDALLYDSGERPSPLVVNPHGGPRARDSKAFDLYTQVLVSQGYTVLQVNYRGSSGRGREFVETLYDDWGGAEQGDVATATEHVLATREWIDDGRVAAFGGSYGGYSAYWQLIQYPDLYDAGVAWIGLTDLADQHENTMPHYRTELMEKYLGSPEENPALYEARSPITHVENLEAPLLIVHGVNDRRVPVSQARLFREALREAGYGEGEGADFEYHELGEEGHASTDPDQKLRMFRLLVDFLDRRVGSAP